MVRMTSLREYKYESLCARVQSGLCQRVTLNYSQFSVHVNDAALIRDLSYQRQDCWVIVNLFWFRGMRVRVATVIFVTNSPMALHIPSGLFVT